MTDAPWNGLPDPLPLLVSSALKAREPYERAHKIAVATETLSKWLVAVRLAGVTPWPPLIQRQFAGTHDELRPTAGTWLRWAEAAGAFTEDESARKSLADAKEFRDLWAHFYQDVAAQLDELGVGSELWWHRLLTSRAVDALRGTLVRGSPWPQWKDRAGHSASLEPWVLLEREEVLLLHHVVWREGRGAYANYHGAHTDHPLAERFLTRPAAEAPRPLVGTQSEQMLSSALGDRRVKFILLVGGEREGGRVYLEAISQDAEFIARTVDVPADASRVVTEVLATPRRAVILASEGPASEAVRLMLGEARTIELRPPTTVDTLTSLNRVLPENLALDAKTAEAAVRSVRGDARQLHALVEAIKASRPRDIGAVRRLLATGETATQVVAAGSSTGARWPRVGAALSPSSRKALDTLLFDPACPSLASDGRLARLTADVQRIGSQFTRRSATELLDPEWGLWLRRWMPDEAVSVVAAMQALVGEHKGRRDDAVRWLSQIGPVRSSSSGRHSLPVSAFLAATLRELLDRDVRGLRLAPFLRGLSIESLAWLTSSPGVEMPEEALFAAAVADFDRDVVTGRRSLLHCALSRSAPRSDADVDFLEQYRGHPFGDMAVSIGNPGSTWIEAAEAWLCRIAWTTHPSGEQWALPSRRAAAPPGIADLINEGTAHAAARVAIAAARHHEPGSSWHAAAEALIASDGNLYWRGERLRDLVSLHLEAGEMEDALATARRIDLPRFRVEALLGISRRVDDPELIASLLEQASGTVASMDDAQLRREYWPKVLDSALDVVAPRSSTILATLDRIDRECSTETCTPAWHRVAIHGSAPSDARRVAKLRAALQPGVLEPVEAPSSSLALPHLPRSRAARRVNAPFPLATPLTNDEWNLLRDGLAIEAVVAPRRLVDFAGICSAATGYHTSSYFSLKLGGAYPRFAVETAWGIFRVVGEHPLTELSKRQPPYRLLGLYDGTRVTLSIDGNVKVASAGGPVRLREGPISLGEQQPGFRPFEGAIHSVRLWGRRGSKWTQIFEAGPT